MKNKKIVYKNKNWVYYYVKNIRTYYYRAKMNNKKMTKQTRIKKEKFYKDIKRLSKQ